MPELSRRDSPSVDPPRIDPAVDAGFNLCADAVALGL